MDNIKELVERLRKNPNRADGRHDCSLGYDAYVAADALEAQAAEIARLTTERDAALEYVPKACATCKKDKRQYLSDGKMDDYCDTCHRNRRCNWEWRGPQKEE